MKTKTLASWSLGPGERKVIHSHGCRTLLSQGHHLREHEGLSGPWDHGPIPVAHSRSNNGLFSWSSSCNLLAKSKPFPSTAVSSSAFLRPHYAQKREMLHREHQLRALSLPSRHCPSTPQNRDSLTGAGVQHFSREREEVRLKS